MALLDLSYSSFQPYLGAPYYELWAQGRGDEQTEALTRYSFGFQLALVSFVPFSLDSRPYFARLSPHRMFWADG
uniref:ORF73 n=1 Tax=Oryza sativa TaxID=4530 RepID=Q35298_ORYSA|nr:ORF73 [Oryza sativa Indica Group]